MVEVLRTPTDDPEVLIPAGIVLTCPKCKAVIAKTVRDVKRLSSVGLDLFAFARGQQPEAGSPAVCKACGGAFMVTDFTRDGRQAMRIHTDVGWISSHPELLTPLS